MPVIVLNKPPPKRRQKPVVTRTVRAAGNGNRNRSRSPTRNTKRKSPVRPAAPSMTTYTRAPANGVKAWELPAPRKKKPATKRLVGGNGARAPGLPLSRTNASKNTTNTRNARRMQPGKGETAKFRALFEKLGIQSELVAKKKPVVVSAPSSSPKLNARARAIAMLRASRQTSPSRTSSPRR